MGGVLLDLELGPVAHELEDYFDLATAPASDVPAVRVRWEPDRGDGDRRPSLRLARDVEWVGDGVRWHRPGGAPIELHARWDDVCLELTVCSCRTPQDRLLERLRPARLAQQLLYLLGVYPAAWVARQREGSELVHASAFELDGLGVVIAGPGGVGKSTLAASALELGARLVSDNLLLVSSARVRGWREPVRLITANSSTTGLQRVGSNGWHGRSDHRLAAERWLDSTIPGLVLLPSIGERTVVHGVEDASTWASRLRTLGGLAGELSRWPAYAAVLDSLLPQPQPAPAQPLTALLAGVRFHRVELARQSTPGQRTELLAGLCSERRVRS